ncbi:MAG: FAD-dependent oxidoreductase [Polyangiaceae bacterium]|nr:FAD-dependent oxidoreductase [Polyangiaceae bacterium]
MSRVGTTERPLRVAVVGAGPAGFYAAAAFLEQTEVAIEVDMLDRLPTPYGLVRGGVAPDRPKMKSVTRLYEKSAEHPNFSFFGNVELGRDVSVGDLLVCYDQVLYAIGNEADRRMGIPGEHLTGCTPAAVFVGWYNGHPDYRSARVDLSCRRVAVVGNGNVALDVARILARSPEELRVTDIAEHALSALCDSRVEEIVVLGRRGPLQASFTPAELRELTELRAARVQISAEELALDETSRAQHDRARPRDPRRQNVELLTKIARSTPPRARRTIRLRFLVSPLELLGDERGSVRAIRLEHNRLVEQRDGSLGAVGTGQVEDLDAGWVLVSIGRRGRSTPGLPFDEQLGVVANIDGRVVDLETRAIRPNQYCAGWARSGPRGLIATSKVASAEVVARMLADAARGSVMEADRGGRAALESLLRDKGVRYVTFEDWKVIDRVEIQRGLARGAPRSKLVAIPEMLDLVEMKRRGW